MQILLSRLERKLVVEALRARASRLESYSRFRPQNAAINDRKAAAMRELSQRLEHHGEKSIDRS